MRKAFTLIFVALSLASPLMSQVSGLSVNKSAYRENYQDNGQVFTVVEQMPEYPGGKDAMFQYIKDNLHYPQSVKDDGIQGRAICQFIVNADGSICCAEIAKSSGNALLDYEAIRLIKNMPAWTPGMQNGQPIRVKYTIPINFRL